jgi:hypothetical protein
MSDDLVLVLNWNTDKNYLCLKVAQKKTEQVLNQGEELPIANTMAYVPKKYRCL